MNDRTRPTDPRSDEQLIARLRATGRDLAPASALEPRVRARLRARRHRRIGQVAAAVVLVVATGATALAVGDDGGARVQTADETTVAPPDSSGVEPQPAAATVPEQSTAPASAETFPPDTGGAVNILVVGTDNGACIDPESPYAPAFGDRSVLGERSDTIMIVRVDPEADRAAVLSFPRDLWVRVDGRSGKSRLNSAFVGDEPQTLINTLYLNFGLRVDHFVQLDFCGFTTVVDAVGGVPVPFDQAARDTHTGLFVPEPGCRTMSGDEALAYVRSRHYETLADGRWVADGTSDLGRVARQQDFVQRTLMRVLSSGIGDPGTLRALFEAVSDSVVVDSSLTISRMLELAGELRSIEPSAIGRYQIDAVPGTVAGNAVLLPQLDSRQMQAVLAWFRGDAASPDVPAAVDAPAASSAPSIAPAPTAVTCG